MASTVTQISQNIDINFPEPGKRISSVSEFQSNFKKIKESFDRLVDEFDALDNESVKKTLSNDFGGNIVKRAQFVNHSHRVNDLGPVANGIVNLNYREGSYHKCLVGTGYYTFNVTNWTRDRTLSKIRLELRNDSTATTSTFFIGFSGNITYFGTPTYQLSLTGNSSAFYDLWTVDSGAEVFVRPIGSLSSLPPTYFSTGTMSTGSTSTGLLAPSITFIIPEYWTNFGGDLATVYGTNFLGTPTVKVNDITVNPAFVSISTTTELTFVTPSGSVGPAEVKIVTTAGFTSTVITYYDNNDTGG